MYIVSFHLHYCSLYVIDCLTKSDYFVGLSIFNLLYPVHWLILYLLRFVYCFFSFELLQLVCLWLFDKKWLLCMILHDSYLISRSFIDSLPALICMFYSFKWIIVAGMILAVWQIVMDLYYWEIIIILYPVHWLVLYLLRSACFALSYKLL